MPQLDSAKPAPSGPEGTGFTAPDALDAALSVVRAWAGRPLAVLLSGSHAAGEAVWAGTREGRVCLSDVDVYVVMPDRAARDAAVARMRAGRGDAARALAARGLLAPLEVAFFTPEDLAALPARPGTLALRARGRVVAGDPGWLARVPAWTARDVSAEEIGLLLENRAFELLWAAPRLAASAELERLRARHAVLKAALELAAADELLAGAWAAAASDRVAHARARLGAGEDARALGALWDTALAWRAGAVAVLPAGESDAEWRAAAAGWRALWWRWSGSVAGESPADPLARVRACARRAPVRRRLREAIRPRARSRRGPGLLARLRHAAAGTPVHRVHACGVALLWSARDAAGPGTVSPELARTLRGLGVLPAAALASHAAASAAAVRAWDEWCQDGARDGDSR